MGRPDWTRDALLDVLTDGAVDGLAELGDIPIPLAPSSDFNSGTDGFTAPTGSIDRNTSDPIDGSGSLEATSSPTETTGDAVQPAQGDKYCGSVKTASSGGQVELWYGVADSSNLYFVGLDATNDEVTMGYYSGGGKTVNATQSVTIDTSTVYDIVLDWRTDGYQEADIDTRAGADVTTISQTDTTYASGSVGARFTDAGAQLDTLSICGEAPDPPPASDLEDFEDNDLSDYFGKNKSNFTIVQNPVFNGTYALEADGGTNGTIMSTSLGYTPARGDTITGKIYVDTVTEAIACTVLFSGGTGDVTSDSGYIVGYAADRDKIFIDRRDSGSQNVIASTSRTSIPSGSWIDIEISLGSPTIAVTVDGTTASVDDSNYDGDQFGFFYNDAKAYFDFFD
jgi:hypothetical protein